VKNYCLSQVYNFKFRFKIVHVKGKAISVICHGDAQGCETSRLPHFLDNRLSDGGGVVRFIRRPATFIPRKIPGNVRTKR
jgi:hypothetical protein